MEREYRNIDQIIALGRLLEALEQFDEETVSACEAEICNLLVAQKTEHDLNVPLSDLVIVALWQVVSEMPIPKDPERVHLCQN